MYDTFLWILFRLATGTGTNNSHVEVLILVAAKHTQRSLAKQVATTTYFPSEKCLSQTFTTRVPKFFVLVPVFETIDAIHRLHAVPLIATWFSPFSPLLILSLSHTHHRLGPLQPPSTLSRIDWNQLIDWLIPILLWHCKPIAAVSKDRCRLSLSIFIFRVSSEGKNACH